MQQDGPLGAATRPAPAAQQVPQHGVAQRQQRGERAPTGVDENVLGLEVALHHLQPVHGLKAVDLVEAVAVGRVTAIWFMGTDPAIGPDSGEPELRHAPVRVVPLPADRHAFALARRAVDALAGSVCRLTVPWGRGAPIELAGTGASPDWRPWLRSLAPAADPSAAGRLRSTGSSTATRPPGAAATLRWSATRRARRCSPAPTSTWPARPRLDDAARRGLLAGTAPPGEDPGPTVRACPGVGGHIIERAIRSRGPGTLEAVAEALGAGTACGSCRPEMARMPEHQRRDVA